MKNKMGKKDIIAEMIGWEPTIETRKEILKAVKESGKSLQEIIGSGELVPLMPDIALLGDDGLFEYKGKRMTSKEFEKVNPLGTFAIITIIGTQEQMDLHRKLCNNEL